MKLLGPSGGDTARITPRRGSQVFTVKENGNGRAGSVFVHFHDPGRLVTNSRWTHTVRCRASRSSTSLRRKWKERRGEAFCRPNETRSPERQRAVKLLRSILSPARGKRFAACLDGPDTRFGMSLAEMGLRYMVGVQGSVSAWRPGEAPLPPKPRGPFGPVHKRFFVARLLTNGVHAVAGLS